jgi:flavin reductase (DIM6/NTAB) family NADH-FMN oxidoreductase RutF/DNA-binding MarR family transcriptional regulator
LTAGNSDVADLSNFLSMSPTATRQILGGLESLGWVTSVPSAEDRRFRHWRVAEQATAALSKAPRFDRNFALAATLEKLGAAGRAALSSEFLKLLGQLRPHNRLLTAMEAFEVSFAEAIDNMDSFDALVNFWLGISIAYRSMRSEQMRFLARATDHQLDSATYMALYRVHEAPSMLPDVAAFLRVDQNTAVRALDKLEALGLLRRKRSAADRRQVLLSVTSKGEQLLASVPPLDESGVYFKAIQGLVSSGQRLAQLLHDLMGGFLSHPVVDPAKLYALLHRVEQASSEAAPSVVQGNFRTAMSHFLTGVAVVTVAEGDSPRGMTVNSLTSVSLDPPILLICFNRKSSSLKRLQDSKKFGVNILTTEQQEIARLFSGAPSAGSLDKSMSHKWGEIDGVPAIEGAVVQIACDLDQTFDAGTHTIVLGRPRSINVDDSVSGAGALGYWRSDYVHMAPGIGEPAE